MSVQKNAACCIGGQDKDFVRLEDPAEHNSREEGERQFRIYQSDQKGTEGNSRGNPREHDSQRCERKETRILPDHWQIHNRWRERKDAPNIFGIMDERLV